MVAVYSRILQGPPESGLDKPRLHYTLAVLSICCRQFRKAPTRKRSPIAASIRHIGESAAADGPRGSEMGSFGRRKR